MDGHGGNGGGKGVKGLGAFNGARLSEELAMVVVARFFCLWCFRVFVFGVLV